MVLETLHSEISINRSIDEVDDQIRLWVEAVLPAVRISFQTPDKTRDGINIYLKSLAPAPPPARGPGRPPLQLILRYLITAHAESAASAHRWLSDLVFAALGSTTVEVDLEPLPDTTWTAFGMPPQPAFILGVPLKHAPDAEAVHYVQFPLEVQTATVVPLHGLVLGPGDFPVPDASVEIPALQRSQRTDANGRFQFIVPSGDWDTTLQISAKNQNFTFTVTPADLKNLPFIIRLDLLTQSD